MTTTRRLAAIMAADVAGFSAAMERDEEGTFALVQELRGKIIEPKIAEHTGRLVKTTGDGFLAEFASPIAAMRCALAIQAETASAALKLRIGLNLGDVIVEANGDVYGEGVNVAARLEALAEPGGILISAKVHSEVEGKVEAAFEDRGEQQVKNISRPVRAYAARIAGVGATSAMTSAGTADVKPLPLPDKPSIAVLPFQNMSGDPEQEYFADGMVEEIITTLSRFRQLFVVARNSSFTYKGKPVDIKQVGRELGVRYVLEGSVRKAAGRVRITGQLIDATTGAHLWAEQFDGTLEDIFDLQESVARRAVSAIVLRIDAADLERVRHKPTASLSAYECFLQALVLFQRHLTHFDEALTLLYRAIELDPQFASAWGLAALFVNVRKQQGRMTDEAGDTAELERLARRAIELGRDDPVALTCGAFVIGRDFGEFDDACAYIDRALILNPSYATAWSVSGFLRACIGQHDVAVDHLARAMRLSPMDPVAYTFQNITGMALMFAGRYDEAAAWIQKALVGYPTFLSALRNLTVSLTLAGRLDEARKALARMLEIDPTRRISTLNQVLPSHFKPEDFAKYVDGLRLAGLPE